MDYINKLLKMKNYYYIVWVKGLMNLKENKNYRGNWELYGITIISMLMALNLLSIVFIFSFFGINLTNSFEVTISPFEKLNGFLTFFVLYLAPVLIPNYFLIFWNNRYEKLFEKYKSYDGKFHVYYVMISLFLPIIIPISGTLIKMTMGIPLK
jgi:hypothetical protein